MVSAVLASSTSPLLQERVRASAGSPALTVGARSSALRASDMAVASGVVMLRLRKLPPTGLVTAGWSHSSQSMKKGKPQLIRGELRFEISQIFVRFAGRVWWSLQPLT